MSANETEKIRSWRIDDSKFTELELRVDDNTICTSCGHLGKIQSHLKGGCGICKTLNGCDETLWKEKRNNIKAEILLRKKALSNALFPFENIINEFLSEPKETPNISLIWYQPNIVRFVRQMGPLLQWPEIYCFQKLFPLLTRWQLRYSKQITDKTCLNFVVPQEIKKMRNLKGVTNLEVFWSDKCNFFDGLIPDVQLHTFLSNEKNGLNRLWTTVEPLSLMEQAYTDLVTKYFLSNDKIGKKQRIAKGKQQADTAKVKYSTDKELLKERVQTIDNLFHKLCTKHVNTTIFCSSPILKNASFELEECEDDKILDLSDVVKVITRNRKINSGLTKFNGKTLNFEYTPCSSKDDPDSLKINKNEKCVFSSDDCFGQTTTEDCITQYNYSSDESTEFDKNASYFFNSSKKVGAHDEFEEIMKTNFLLYN